jgi:hypothetical protein
VGVSALSRFEAETCFPPDSPIERHMMSLLDEGPGVGTVAGFLPPMSWHAAIEIARTERELLARRPILVVPQAQVGRRRADMLVLTRSRLARPGWHGDPASAFFIECDGKDHHGATADQIRDDLQREREIHRATGLAMLRFSGAEINFRPHQVHQVLAARVEAMHALHEFGEEVRDEAERVFRHVGRVSCHPALRTEYQARNRPPPPDRYDESDPTGERYASEGDLEWDAFEAMRDAVARLRHAAARCRLGGPQWEDEEAFPDRRFRPIGDVLAGLIRR